MKETNTPSKTVKVRKLFWLEKEQAKLIEKSAKMQNISESAYMRSIINKI